MSPFNKIPLLFIGLFLLVAAWIPPVNNSLGEEPPSKSLDQAKCDFNIFWPPVDPEKAQATSPPPLLKGILTVNTQRQSHNTTEIRLNVSITRPSTEADRQFWNTTLAYADIDWMKEVRVWDDHHQWLWPNLPYLLRLPGTERIERYGGMDPGKHVDNDFAAVLIRKYDARGEEESPETRDSPLVSAEWHPADGAKTDMFSVVHTAQSDMFTLHVGGEHATTRGQFKVWLIYADFLGARLPRSWPKEREWAGGALAFFLIDWEVDPDQNCRGVVQSVKPREGTRFHWADWVVREPDSDRSEAVFRLSDKP